MKCSLCSPEKIEKSGALSLRLSHDTKPQACNMSSTKPNTIRTNNYDFFLAALRESISTTDIDSIYMTLSEDLIHYTSDYVIYFLNNALNPQEGLEKFIKTICTTDRYITAEEYQYDIDLFRHKGASMKPLTPFLIDLTEEEMSIDYIMEKRYMSSYESIRPRISLIDLYWDELDTDYILNAYNWDSLEEYDEDEGDHEFPKWFKSDDGEFTPSSIRKAYYTFIKSLSSKLEKSEEPKYCKSYYKVITDHTFDVKFIEDFAQ